jgi:hypothetical protein
MFQAGLGKKQNLISKIIRAKRNRGMAQVTQCLPHKHDALNSNSNGTKGKKILIFKYMQQNMTFTLIVQIP